MPGGITGGTFAMVGYEAIAIVAVLAIIFLWGPQKLPEMARSIGQAKSEFDKAYKQATSLADPSSLLKSATSSPVTESAQPTQTTQPPQDPILVAAKSLGINTEGKTKGEIAKEIADRSVKSSAPPSEKGTSTPVAETP
jgi:sec-independent protein translocase protein TatA